MTSKSRRAVEEEILLEARRLLDQQVSVGEFSSRFFGPDGMLRRLWKTDDDRRLLISSPVYRELRKMLATLGKREVADFEASCERLSGRLTVVVPKSLHAALRAEAVREGTSLSELIRLKLGVPYSLTAEWIARAHPKSAAA